MYNGRTIKIPAKSVKSWVFFIFKRICSLINIIVDIVHVISVTEQHF